MTSSYKRKLSRNNFCKKNCRIFLWTTSVTIFVVLPQSAIWRAIALQRPDRSILPWLMFLPLAWTHPYTTSVNFIQYRKHVDLFYPMMLQQDSKLQSFAEREFSVCALSLWLLSGDSKAIQGTGAILNQAINCPFGTVIAHASCRVVCLWDIFGCIYIFGYIWNGICSYFLRDGLSCWFFS